MLLLERLIEEIFVKILFHTHWFENPNSNLIIGSFLFLLYVRDPDNIS